MRRPRRWDILSRHSQYQLWVGEVQFYESSYFGWIIVTVLLLGGFSYFGGGSWYNSSSRGLRGAAALPHRQFWMEVAGLVEDGVNFTREIVRGRSGRSQRGYTGSRGRSADSKEGSSLLRGTKEKKTSSSKDKSKKSKFSDSSKRKTGKSAVGDGNPSEGNNYGATSSLVPQASIPGSDREVRLPSAAATAAGDGAYSSLRRCSI